MQDDAKILQSDGQQTTSRNHAVQDDAIIFMSLGQFVATCILAVSVPVQGGGH